MPTNVLGIFFLFGLSIGRSNTPSQPAPVPSGMDLLYSDRIPFKKTGEPIITLGLMSNQKQVRLSADSNITAEYFETGVYKKTTIPAKSSIQITIKRAQSAKRNFYVDLEGIPWNRRSRLDWSISRWRARGYAQVEAIEEGTVLGIGGQVLDNREYRVILVVPNAQKANQVISQVYNLFGVRAFMGARLKERPWAELSLFSRNVRIGSATSFIRLNADSDVIHVEAVEHGRGYKWHGFENRSYRGEIYVVVDPQGLLAVVNVLGSETILAGVVPSEMFASAPAESLKAQAVAARNQLFAKLSKRHHDDPYHLCAEQHCQVYAGSKKENPKSNAAISATFGEILFREQILVDTVYSATCGGHTEDNESVWGNTPNPALRGQLDLVQESEDSLQSYKSGLNDDNIHSWIDAHPDTYCFRASKMRPHKFRWQKQMSCKQLQELLNPRFGWIGQLRRIKINERGNGGRVISIKLVGSKDVATVVHELPIRRLFGNLNSGVFVVDHELDAAGNLLRLSFRGGGWGHGVGMCQMGAIGRAEAGQHYRQILEYYYNGAKVQQLYKPE